MRGGGGKLQPKQAHCRVANQMADGHWIYRLFKRYTFSSISIIVERVEFYDFLHYKWLKKQTSFTHISDQTDT